MSEVDRKRWNERYSSGWRTVIHKTLLDFYPLAKRGRALELACGTGENAVFLAKQGFHVDAVDVSDVAIDRARALAKEEGLYVNFIRADLDEYDLPENTYDLVVVFYYLNRKLFPKIEKALKKGGVLIYQTYNERHLSIRHDFNREYLLRLGELCSSFPELQLIHCKEEDNVSTLIARKD